MREFSTYTMLDIAGSMAGVFAFAALLGLPGYLIGWISNFADFRRASFTDRLAWAVPLSLGVFTYPMVVVAKYVSLPVACYLLLTLSVGGLGILASDYWKLRSAGRTRTSYSARNLFVFACITGWALAIVLQLVDVGWDGRLYMSATAYDHSVRNAFVQAVVRTGVPPHNPLYCSALGSSAIAACQPAPMRYYYFWYVLCGAVVKLTGISSRQALIAGCAWSGIAFACLVRLYVRHYLGGDENTVSRRTIAGIALLSVTGLDLLAIAYNFARLHFLPLDLEWWSETQVSSWMDTMLWAPHHLGALICCLLGFLIVWIAPGLHKSQRWLGMLVAGTSFASAFGLSVYIAAAFGIVQISWLCWQVVSNRTNLRRLGTLIGGGLIGILLLMPYLSELRSDGSNATDGTGRTHVLAFGIRTMIPESRVTHHPAVMRLAQAHPRLVHRALRVALLLPSYFVELGVYGLVLIVFIGMVRKRAHLREPQEHALFLAIASLVVCTFVRSDVIATNDFGIRASLIPQFFLLLLLLSVTHAMWKKLPPVLQWSGVAMLAIGVLGTASQVLLLRLYYPVEEGMKHFSLGDLSAETMVLRDVGGVLENKVPANAVVQFNLNLPDRAYLYAHLLNTPRQLVNGDEVCDSVFGGDASACDGILKSIGTLYLEPKYLVDLDQAEAASVGGPASAQLLCNELKIDYLVATRWDRIWKVQDSWVWTLPAISSNPDARVIHCR